MLHVTRGARQLLRVRGACFARDDSVALAGDVERVYAVVGSYVDVEVRARLTVERCAHERACAWGGARGATNACSLAHRAA